MSARIDTAAERIKLRGFMPSRQDPCFTAPVDLLTGYRAALDEIDRLTAALAEAEDRGAAQMRERAADEVVNQDCSAGDIAAAIRALPLREPGGA